uniref:Uncharacterized protein n=1 Tax=viral metagenome TaxID=1070528 RepID=A0A6C0B0P4_9ZZZZ
MSDKKEEDEEKKKFIEGLRTYFKLKEEYEKSVKKQNKIISKLKDLSWKEKRLELSKIKHKCINCKRPVGSIFSTKIDNHERQLIALCGDRKEPCPLDIKIFLGMVYNLADDLREDEETLNEYKRSIIFDKNDLLFGYITAENAVSKFDNIKDAVAESTKKYEFTLENYLQVVDNDEKKEELRSLQIDFYRNIEHFNTLIKQFNSSQNTQFIVDAVDLYVDTMLPKMSMILSKKYAYNGVEYDEEDNTFHLVQIPFSIDDLEWDISEKGQKVASMKIGMDSFSKKKPVKNNKLQFTAAIPDIKKSDTTPPSNDSWRYR